MRNKFVHEDGRLGSDLDRQKLKTYISNYPDLGFEVVEVDEDHFMKLSHEFIETFITFLQFICSRSITSRTAITCCGVKNSEEIEISVNCFMVGLSNKD